jgi:flavin-dependent dehydrogenase
MEKAARVLVAGGGPAGSTAATLLARQGFEVSLFEAETFPRYHIGESILPSCLPIFDLLGVREKIEKHGFVRKDGAYFEWGADAEEWTLDFDHLATENNWGYQVIRSEFDQLLLEHAREQGVRVHEGVRLRSVEFDGDRAVAGNWATGGQTGTIEFDYLVDATGRAGVMSTKHLRNRRFHEVYRNVAFWTYWRDVQPFNRGPQGAILVRSTPLGWFWIIPLHDGTTSIGLVMNKNKFAQERERLGSMEAIYDEMIAECALTAELLKGAHRVPGAMRADQDFTYAADDFAGPGYVLSGDAACFVDPLLSTGVHLATYSGMLAAATLGSLLRNEIAESEALPFYTKAYRAAYERIAVLVSFLYLDFKREAQIVEAEKLTRRERHLVRLYESFLTIAAGVEDLNDALEGGSVDAASTRIATSGHLFTDSAMAAFPTSSLSAVSGLYVTTEPRLGLRDVASGAAAAR